LPTAPGELTGSGSQDSAGRKTTAAATGEPTALNREGIDRVRLSGFACREVGLQGTVVGETPATHLLDLGLVSCVESREAAAPAVGLGVVRVPALAIRED
jgi:hypothetical protein